jgi:glutamate synthase domain-containing protein 2
MLWLLAATVVVGILLVLALVDIFQTKHAIRRNFPIIGRLRYALEWMGPELRQYIVTDNDEERPFSRDQRRWVYATAKQQNQYFGFGTDNKMDSPQYPIIRHAAFPYQPPQASNDDHPLPSAKIVGEWRDRTGAFRPRSIVGISAMSFGSLSGPAIEALNKGAAMAGALHNTGEGGISKHHLHGGDLILQLGTGYFGARTADGRFDLDAAAALVERAPVKAIEIKLSQGAKPGLGGVLPGSKVTAEIAEARGVPVGITVASPAHHVEFGSIAEMVAFVERVADGTGVPVGIKSAVGDRSFWSELAEEMAASGRGPDFITIDGGEGGTGAAPLVFSDHVSLPFRAGFAEAYQAFARRGMHDRVTWIGSGKLGFPGEALLAMALGVDLISVGREAMLAVGCIQAQKCHSGHCPTGVATHSKWLTRGLDPTDKSVRVGHYLIGLRHELLKLAHACGQPHPALVSGHNIDLLMDGECPVPLWQQFDYDESWRKSSPDTERQIESLMTAAGQAL